MLGWSKSAGGLSQFLLALFAWFDEARATQSRSMGTNQGMAGEEFMKSSVNAVSHKGLVALALHEGIVPARYLDSKNIWTWGIGHTAAAGDPNPTKMPFGMPANLDSELVKVVKVFRQDLVRYSRAVNQALCVPVEQHEFDALVSFHYNTGGINRADLTKHLNAGRRKAAADAFMGWRRPKEVISRRRAEQNLFRNGIYPTGNIPVWGVSKTGKLTWRTVRIVTPPELLALMEGSTLYA